MRKLQTEYGVGYLTEKQWQLLCHRFDIKEVEVDYLRPCICSEYNYCFGCPFVAAMGEKGGGLCFGYLDWHGLDTSHLELGSCRIIAYDDTGLAQAWAIREHFRGLTKVEGRSDD